jgi:hypothetical protein
MVDFSIAASSVCAIVMYFLSYQNHALFSTRTHPSPSIGHPADTALS